MAEKKTIYELVPQIPGESDASYHRLIVFLKKGFNTLQEFADYLQTQNDIPPVTYKTIEANSHKNNWTERRKKYWEYREKERDEHALEIINILDELGIKGMKQAKKNITLKSVKKGIAILLLILG